MWGERPPDRGALLQAGGCAQGQMPAVRSLRESTVQSSSAEPPEQGRKPQSLMEDNASGRLQ
jgi:hypothetical protein